MKSVGGQFVQTNLSFVQSISALLARPAGRQFCSHGSVIWIQLQEMPGFELPCAEALQKPACKR